MNTVTVCLCGCGEPAAYAERHVRPSLRAENRLKRWEERETGYETPCHIWLGRFDYGKRPGRYGIIYHDGRYQKIHRVIWQQTHGPIPKGLHLHHLCRTTQCVNPAHLIPVSPREHMRLERAKLTPDNLRYIRESPKTGVALAEELGVSTSLVSQVRTGVIWADVR